MAKVDELLSLPLLLYIPLPLCPVLFFHRTNYTVPTAPSGHDFNGVRSTSRAAWQPKMEETGKIHWEKKKTRMLPFCSWFLFRGKLGQKMDYISFQQLFEHLTTNQIDFRSSKSTIQLKLTWKTEPFSAVRNAKPETQPGSQTCDVKMMLRIGIFAKAPKWQWFFSGVFGTCCRSKELMMSLVNSASKTTLGRE